MTAHTPHRSPRSDVASGIPTQRPTSHLARLDVEPNPRPAVEAEVEAARAKVDKLRRAVGERRAGAAALHVAEYELHRALARLDELAPEPPDAA